MIDYLTIVQNMAKRCRAFKKEIFTIFFKDKTSDEPSRELYCWTPLYRQFFEPIEKIIKMCDFLGIKHLEDNRDYLLDNINSLEDPRLIGTKKRFIHHVDNIRSVFKKVQEKINSEISKLDKVERNKLNEAIHTFFEGCYYSTVAMSVCAVEYRLLKLMTNVNPKEVRKLKKPTLGQLIHVYLENKDVYKHIVPEKHENLLNLCNRYRLSAVHPKGEEIGRRVASSILNLTFEFLLTK